MTDMFLKLWHGNLFWLGVWETVYLSLIHI